MVRASSSLQAAALNAERWERHGPAISLLPIFKDSPDDLIQTQFMKQEGGFSKVFPKQAGPVCKGVAHSEKKQDLEELFLIWGFQGSPRGSLSLHDQA